jgi:excisionase family DNA binding protein
MRTVDFGPPSAWEGRTTAVEILTKEETAKLLRISTRTLERLVTAHRIKCLRYSKRSVRFRQADIDRFLKRSVQDDNPVAA